MGEEEGKAHVEDHLADDVLVREVLVAKVEVGCERGKRSASKRSGKGEE